MSVYCVSDLHLSRKQDKPMDVFGERWLRHWDKIRADWRDRVGPDDVVLSAGDISWGMRLDDAKADLEEIDALPGRKIFVRGNHDYFWSSISKLRSLGLPTLSFIQNDSISFGGRAFCGTRGWTVPEPKATPTPEDRKIFARELMRLEQSLKSAAERFGDLEPVGMIHFPPFNSTLKKSEFTDLFSAYGVKTVVFGHLHGFLPGDYPSCVRVDGVSYRLTSCDFLENKLLKLF